MKVLRKLLGKGFILLGLLLIYPSTAKADEIILNKDKTDGVNIRKEKSNSSEVLGGIEDYNRYPIKSEDRFWYIIDYKGENAYVGKEWFYRLKDVRVIKETNLLSAPSKNAKDKINYKLKPNSELTILAFVEGSDYVKVAYKPAKKENKELNIKKNDKLKDKKVDMEEQIGFVKISSLDLSRRSKKYLNKVQKTYKELNESKDKHEKIEEEERVAQEESQQGGDNAYEVIYVSYFTNDDGEVINKDESQIGKSIYNYALDYVGSPYVFGGISKTNGIDCSGLVLKVYENFGLDLPHLAKSQAEYGETVAFGEEKAGDLVFFGSSYNDIYHVGIADGLGNMVHAASPGQGVIVSPINNPFVIKRIFE